MTNQIVGSQKNSSQLKNDQSIEQFLTFALAEDRQALLPTRQLLEIVNVNLSQITAIAGLHPSVMGIYNWRGDVIWVVDLASLLGYPPLYAQEYNLAKFQDRCHILFVRSQDLVVGFAVHHVGQMVRCDTSKIQSSVLSFSNQLMPDGFSGYWLSGNNETLLVLDGDAIMRVVQAFSA